MADAREWQFTALTPLWTGRVTRIEERHRNGRTELRETIESDRLIMTGLLGSIRWWFEVLVRGVRGSACDPSDTKCQGKAHCVGCELFGCTGWARKFRFQALAGTQGDTLQKDSIKKGAQFRLRFQPLRSIAEEEWALLDLTLRLIADYGAIGGKTTLKPSDENGRAGQQHHQDYGIIELERGPQLPRLARGSLEAYLRNEKWRSARNANFAWASLQHFWCVNDRYLARQHAGASQFNQVIGRQEQKTQGQQIRNDQRQANQWLAGRQAESKKAFSFKNPARTFGFINPPEVDSAEIERRLTQTWPGVRGDEILKGDAILGRLLDRGAGTS